MTRKNAHLVLACWQAWTWLSWPAWTVLSTGLFMHVGIDNCSWPLDERTDLNSVVHTWYNMLSGNDEITRLNSNVTTTMNLVVVTSRVLHVLTYTRTTQVVDSSSCIHYVETWLNNTVILLTLSYHVNSAVTGLLIWANIIACGIFKRVNKSPVILELASVGSPCHAFVQRRNYCFLYCFFVWIVCKRNGESCK